MNKVKDYVKKTAGISDYAEELKNGMNGLEINHKVNYDPKDLYRAAAIGGGAIGGLAGLGALGGGALISNSINRQNKQASIETESIESLAEKVAGVKETLKRWAGTAPSPKPRIGSETETIKKETIDKVKKKVEEKANSSKEEIEEKVKEKVDSSKENIKEKVKEKAEEKSEGGIKDKVVETAGKVKDYVENNSGIAAGVGAGALAGLGAYAYKKHKDKNKKKKIAGYINNTGIPVEELNRARNTSLGISAGLIGTGLGLGAYNVSQGENFDGHDQLLNNGHLMALGAGSGISSALFNERLKRAEGNKVAEYVAKTAKINPKFYSKLDNLSKSVNNLEGVHPEGVKDETGEKLKEEFKNKLEDSEDVKDKAVETASKVKEYVGNHLD